MAQRAPTTCHAWPCPPTAGAKQQTMQPRQIRKGSATDRAASSQPSLVEVGAGSVGGSGVAVDVVVVVW